jgi:hypothetical protein
MVGQQGPGVNRGLERGGEVTKALDKLAPIFRIRHNLAFLDAPDDDIVDRAGSIQPNRACRGTSSSSFFMPGNIISQLIQQRPLFPLANMNPQEHGGDFSAPLVACIAHRLKRGECTADT